MLKRLLAQLVKGAPPPPPQPDAEVQRLVAEAEAARTRGEWKAALPLLECAVSMAPRLADARIAFASLLRDIGKTRLAVEHSRAVLEEDVTAASPLPRAARSPGEAIKMALTLPHVPESREEISAVREQLSATIDDLLTAKVSVSDPAEIGVTAFYLAYHGRNDRTLQRKIAELHLAACPALTFTAPAPKRERRIRVGVVSDYLHDHSIGRITQGLIDKLDRARFEVHVFPFRDAFDPLSHAIRASADRWTVLPRDFAEARKRVAEHPLDVLLYPDIGMDPLTYYMAFSRLAPVQCTTWGHPVTTGVPTIDWFISTEGFEPADAESHYTERLVKLRDSAVPGYYYRPEAVPAESRSALGFDPDRHTYFCPQTLFKLHPDFDEIAAGILRRDPDGEVVLLYDSKADVLRRRRLEARMKRTAADVVDRIVFVPRTPRAGYLQRLRACDVVLDTLHFCGGNTSLEAISAGAPVVTLPGAFNRGRHTSSFYRRMGLTDSIALTPEEYCDIAVKIGSDADYRGELSRAQAERSHVLFEQHAAVERIAEFFESAVEAARR